MPLAKDLTKFSTASPVNAQYSYTDIVDGLGIVTIYVSKVGDSTSNGYILTTKVYKSQVIGSSISMGASSYTIDMTPFTSPRTATGTAMFSGVASITSGVWTSDVELFRVSGGVETSLGTAVTSYDGGNNQRNLWEYPVTETHFAQGDFLRLKITNTGAGLNVGANTDGQVGSPAVSDQSFRIDLPFKIDI